MHIFPVVHPFVESDIILRICYKSLPTATIKIELGRMCGKSIEHSCVNFFLDNEMNDE